MDGRISVARGLGLRGDGIEEPSVRPGWKGSHYKQEGAAHLEHGEVTECYRVCNGILRSVA